MSRAAIDARIQDRTPRARLAVRKRPYWRQLSEGAFLGYYRGILKGSWVAKYHDAATDAYVTGTLGEADDELDADGRNILSYKQAFDAALRWIERKTSGDDVPPAIVSDPDMTVAQAVQAYIALRDARSSQRAGRDIKSDASSSLTRNVLEDKRLPIVRLAALVEADLRDWQQRCSLRKPSSLQRIVNDLKAALNHSFALNRRVLPADLPTVIKFGLKLDAPELLTAAARDNQILSDDEVRAIVAAAIALDEDFGRLVVLLAATGARFSQIARMTVGDVQLGQSRLMLPQSFKGRKRTLSHIRVPVGADTIAAVEPATRGRSPAAPLLEHWRHRQVGPMQWERVDRRPWNSSSAMLRPFHQAVADAGLSGAIIPYALRHSSIVRSLRAGLPIRLVAALHDTSVVMIERHYSRWITEGLDELVARAVVPIVALAA